MATARRFSEAKAITLIERVYKSRGRVPGCDECRLAGYRGGTAHFNAARSEWARKHGIELRPSYRDDVAYLPKDLKAECEAARLFKLPKPETERYQGRPIDPPRLSVTEEAVKNYRASWRRIKEAGA